ncbi:replicative DNA helicase [Jeotgalibacillus malaysiensis]|uniref:replicative DNA helicase n=1 Tax=Jeotgalibacillus malaysiensis TaxID=1508404 RepID=UPI00384C032E
MDGLESVTSGYRERMRRLALFDPLYELDRRQDKDARQKPIDMKGFGLLTLLFFFEKKIIRDLKNGSKELAEYLGSISRLEYELPPDQLEKLAQTIIQTFRPATGKKRAYPFFNWETKQEEEIEYSILKDNNFDLKTNRQYYTLDEDGLELVFATKEFYSEFQLSINQLMLRKQLEKGEFQGALKQINEMRLNVESLHERMVKLRHEIQRNIVSEDTFDRYKQLIEDSHLRLERENEEFSELREFVRETQERLAEKDFYKREQKAYDTVLKIQKHLEEVHYQHSDLLTQSIDLKNHTLKAAQESLYYTGIEAFNFDQDITATIIAGPLPLEALKGVLHPFLTVQEEKRWSPLTLFAEQNILEERDAPNDDRFNDVPSEEEESKYHQQLKTMYGTFMERTLEAMEQGAHDLRTIMDALDENGHGELFDTRYFYDFWLLLHQRSPLKENDVQNEDSSHVLDAALAHLQGRELVIKETNDVILVNDRFSIQNMDVETVKEEEDALSGG